MLCLLWHRGIGGKSITIDFEDMQKLNKIERKKEIDTKYKVKPETV